MIQQRYLSDGTPVEVVKREKNEAGLNEVQIKPVGKDRFESGVNPWILECYLLSESPQPESEKSDRGTL